MSSLILNDSTLIITSLQAHHLPSNNGGVSEEIILEVVVGNKQNNYQKEISSPFPAVSGQIQHNEYSASNLLICFSSLPCISYSHTVTRKGEARKEEEVVI